MDAKDVYHDAVRDALQKEQWKITHDPLYLAVGGVEMYIDLGAEPLLAAEKDDEKIAVEVKSFLQPSTISEFHTAVGQFLNYRRALRTTDQNATSIWRFRQKSTQLSLHCHLSATGGQNINCICWFTMLRRG